MTPERKAELLAAATQGRLTHLLANWPDRAYTTIRDLQSGALDRVPEEEMRELTTEPSLLDLEEGSLGSVAQNWRLAGWLLRCDPYDLPAPVALVVLTARIQDLEWRRHLCVQTVRDQGASWAKVAHLLGITRQSAWSRYRRLTLSVVEDNAVTS